MTISRSPARSGGISAAPSPSGAWRTAALAGLAGVALVACTLATPRGLEAAESSHGSLAWTVGTWTGSRGDGTDAPRAPLTLKVAPILGGAGYTEDLEVRGEAGVYRGFAIVVYDRQDKVWVREYVNAVRGHFVRLSGMVEGDRSTWHVDPPGPRRQARLVSERVDADHWRRTHSISKDGGKTWQVLWEDRLERVPAL